MSPHEKEREQEDVYTKTETIHNPIPTYLLFVCVNILLVKKINCASNILQTIDTIPTYHLSRKFREYTGNDCSSGIPDIFSKTSAQIGRFVAANIWLALAACLRVVRAIILPRGVNSSRGLRRRGSAWP